MPVNNDKIMNLIGQLETLLHANAILKENAYHLLIDLCNQLEEIDNKSDLIPIADQQKLISLLHHFQINCFSHLIITHSHQSPSYISILKWLVNMINIYGFVPYFVKTDYPNAVLQWISLQQNLPLQTCFLIHNLLHNLTRHWIDVKALNKHETISNNGLVQKSNIS